MSFPAMNPSLRQLMIAVAIVAGLLGLVRACYRGLQRLDEWGTAIHQQSVTRTLAEWEREYDQVRDWRERDRAIDMLKSIPEYYVPAPGYRSDPKTEAEQHRQRQRTLLAIATALRKFTGEDFGVDATQWRAWVARGGQPKGSSGVSPKPSSAPEPSVVQ